MKEYFNLPGYKELIKLEENGKISFFDENFFKLLSYRSNIITQIQYDRENYYFLLIHKYLTRSILFSEFRAQFLQMEMEDNEKASTILKDFQQLEVFSFAQDLEKFFYLKGEIYDLC